MRSNLLSTTAAAAVVVVTVKKTEKRKDKGEIVRVGGRGIALENSGFQPGFIKCRNKTCTVEVQIRPETVFKTTVFCF